LTVHDRDRDRAEPGFPRLIGACLPYAFVAPAGSPAATGCGALTSQGEFAARVSTCGGYDAPTVRDVARRGRHRSRATRIYHIHFSAADSIR